MKEKTLLKISLIITIIGIAMLFIYSEKIDSEKNEIMPEFIDKDIKISGTITKLTKTDNLVFLELSYEKKTKGIIFNKNLGNLNIKKGDSVSVTGELEEYQGELELIINRIEK